MKAQMIASGHRFAPTYGIGSSQAHLLHRQHDGLRPCLGASGLLRPDLPVGGIELQQFPKVVTACQEQILECSEGGDSCDALKSKLQERLSQHAISWANCCHIIGPLLEAFGEHEVEATGYSIPGFHGICASLMDVASWPFLQEVTPAPVETPTDLKSWEARFDLLRNRDYLLSAPAPRAFGRERILLHSRGDDGVETLNSLWINFRL